eukprot:4087356-Pleurochrysis_carterae.AAC.1
MRSMREGNEKEAGSWEGGSETGRIEASDRWEGGGQVVGVIHNGSDSEGENREGQGGTSEAERERAGQERG